MVGRKMPTIAENMQTILIREGITSVLWGDSGLLDECATLSGIARKHPLDRWQNVLAGLERAPHIFDKGYIRVDGCWQGKRSLRVRCFTLKYRQLGLPLDNPKV